MNYSVKHQVLALVCGILAGVSTWLYLSSLNRTTPVLVASKFISKHEVIETDSVKVVRANTSPWDDLLAHSAGDALGKIALVDIEMGEPLLLTRIAPEDSWLRLRYDLASNERALFIPLDIERFPAGMVCTGDRIDLIGVQKRGGALVTGVSMQSLRVLAANPEGEKPSIHSTGVTPTGGASRRKTLGSLSGETTSTYFRQATGLVVAVTHDEAVRLTELLESGDLYVVLAGTGAIPADYQPSISGAWTTDVTGIYEDVDQSESEWAADSLTGVPETYEDFNPGGGE